MTNRTLNKYRERFTNRIINAGVTEFLSLNDKRIIRFVNIGGVFTSVFCLIIAIITLFINPEINGVLICLGLSISFFFIPFINRFGLFQITKLFVLLPLTFAIVFWCFMVTKTPYYLIIPSIVAYMFYPKKIYQVLTLFVFFIIFIFVKYDSFAADDYVTMFYDFCLFFAVFVLLMIIQQSFIDYEQKMLALNESLKNKNNQLQYQQQLKRSEQFFRSIFENNYLGIVVLDANREFKRINPAFCKQLGFEESYILSKNFLDLSAQHSTTCKVNYDKLIQGVIKNYEAKGTFIKSNGKTLNAQLIINGVYDINNTFLEAIITIQDITEAYEAQEALEQSELRFRTLFDNSPWGITIAHLGKDKIVEINQGALNTLGMSKEEFFELQEKNLLAERTNIKKDAYIIDKLVKGESKAITTQKMFKRANGNKLFTEITRSLINIEDDIYVVSMTKDITLTIEVEKERKARFKEMQTFFDALPISFLFLDTNNRILRGNQESLGDDTEKYIGYKVTDLYKHLSEETIAFNNLVIESGTPLLKKIEHFLVEGQDVWVRVDRIPVKDDEGKVTGLIVFSTDITDIKKAEAELAVKNSELEHYIQTNLQLESFAYIASHDLKEPLRMIHSFTQLLNRKLRPHFDATADEYMNFILSGVHRMQNLLEDLLKYSTIGRGEKDLELVDLNDTIYNVIQNVQHSIKEKNAEIYIENLPKVKAISIQMIQLFQNLISNALKFVPEDRQPIVKIKVKTGAEYYEFEVSDNGIGIREEFMEKIFLVFKRLHKKDEYEGTGIGLATCKKIVENLNGQIRVESTYGLGTSFFFTLPR